MPTAWAFLLVVKSKLRESPQGQSMNLLHPFPPPLGSSTAERSTSKTMRELSLFSGELRNHQEQLVSRARTSGAGSLSDRELLELLLRAGAARQDTGSMADTLLSVFGDLPSVLMAKQERLEKVATEDAACAIGMITEAAQRLTRKQLAQQPVISSWDTLIKYCRAQMAYLKSEVFHVLFLDRANRLIADERMGSGTVDHVPVYPREILKRSLELDACALILVHNHPSGDPTPSEADIAMTQMIQTAADSLSITLHDHVIVGATGETSMNAEGLI